MSHLVLSRKYRPQSFDELRGQEHVGRILRNAIASGRVGHAYLFVGPRGVGKTTTARIFARALNCTGPVASGNEAGTGAPDPCGVCGSCRDIAAGADLDVVEMDAASNNHVEDVRRLREQVGYAAVRSRFRIWIVDEVHMLSLPAFNAFLKTLEEPPDRVKFVFCTTEEQKLPDTFRSRCQRIEFRPIGQDVMASRLADLARRENVEVEDGLLDEISAAASGGLRDAESLLEQLIAGCPDRLLRREDLDALAGRAPRSRLDALEAAVLARDAPAALDAVDLALAGGCKPGVFLEQWMERIRSAMVDAARTRASGAPRPGPSVARLARSLDVLLDKRLHLRAGADGVLVCQVAAVELARLPDARDLDRLLEGLEAARTSAGASASPAPAEGRPAASDRAPRQGEEGARTLPPGPSASRGRKAESRSRDSAVEVLRTRWSEVVARAAARDARIATALERARPTAVEDGALEVTVARGDALAVSTLERRESLLVVREILGTLLGAPLALRVLEGEVASPRQGASSEPAQRGTPSLGRAAEASTAGAPAIDAPAQGEAGRSERPRASEAMPPRAEDHPAVQRVREWTGGKLLNVERAPRAPRAPR